MNRFHWIARLSPALCIVIGACAMAPKTETQHTQGPGKLISEQMIADYAVSNAWEVLRKSGRYMASRDDGPGAGTSLRSKRGRTSFNLGGSDVPRVIVDGNNLTDMHALKSIPASSIAWIQILGGIEGTTFEGTNSGAGIIIIVTKAGS